MIKKENISYSIIYGIFTSIMPILMSGIVIIWVYGNIDSLKSGSIIDTIFIFIGFSIAMGLSIIPTTFVALISGYIWGINALIPLIISYIFATVIGSNLSKWIDNDQILTQINKSAKAKNILNRLQNEQFKIIALARMSPVFPFGISNVIFTYMGVSLRNLLFAGILGMLPRTIFMVWLATKAENIQILLNNNWHYYINSPIFWIGIGSVILLFIIVYKAFSNTKIVENP
jgi:uncharacterized membrane protein YdjX (TVP38/TMEM64 family)